MLYADDIANIENYIKLLNKSTLSGLSDSANLATDAIIASESQKIDVIAAKKKSIMYLLGDITARKQTVSEEMTNTTSQFIKELEKASVSGAQQPSSDAFRIYNKGSEDDINAGSTTFSDNLTKLSNMLVDSAKELAYLSAFEAKISDAISDLSAEADRSADIIAFVSAVRSAAAATS